MNSRTDPVGGAATVAKLREHGRQCLTALGEDARSEADLLLAAALACSRAWLHAHADAPVDRATAAVYLDWLQRRAAGEPHAYLTGAREFWSLPLRVSPAVLIPRPDTERLVEAALAVLPVDRPTRLADLGTGSGAIALAIARERPSADVIATDASKEALAIARQNAEMLGLDDRIEFRRGLWYGALDGSGEPFDVIVSNPPYIAEGDPHLGRDGLPFEPALALASGADGLDAIREIVGGAGEFVRRGGWLLLEHGAAQGASVRTLMSAHGFGSVETLLDLESRERVTRGRR